MQAFMGVSDIPKLIENLASGSHPTVVGGISTTELLSYLKKNFLWVEAAGGVLHTSNYRWLLIYRNGRWDLPKGMIEPGEQIEEAALREVSEETGVSRHTIEFPLIDTFHIYNTYGRWTAKQTHWFVMHTDVETTTIPQTEEGITRVEWLTPKERNQALQSSYSMMQYIDNMLSNFEKTASNNKLSLANTNLSTGY